MSARPDLIVVGGSAGGVEALTQLVVGLGRRDDACVVAVIHVSPHYPNLLTGVLAAAVPLPVREAIDKVPLVPGIVTVAPAGYHLLVERDRSLALSCDPPVNYSRPAIDVLFESAADAFGPAVAGVVLSGASSDGAHGLRAIQRAGGAVLVQDPATAGAPAMPQAALAAIGRPDAIGAPAALGAWLAARLAAGGAAR